jgi:hypothetical protein
VIPYIGREEAWVMSEPENLILAHLREMWADMTARFDELDSKFERRFAAIEARLDKLDANAAKFMRSFVGHRTMTERTFASFEVQLEQLEARVTRLERAGA